MGTSWAVGAASTLGIVVAAGFSPVGVAITGGPSLVAAIVIGVALATWAYAIAMAAHGSKGALVALLLIEVGSVAWAASRFGPCGASCLSGVQIAFLALAALIPLVAAWATLAEVRSRRGAIQWGTAILFAAPTLLVMSASAAFALSVKGGA